MIQNRLLSQHDPYMYILCRREAARVRFFKSASKPGDAKCIRVFGERGGLGGVITCAL
jgi:hypothetical protein